VHESAVKGKQGLGGPSATGGNDDKDKGDKHTMVPVVEAQKKKKVKSASLQKEVEKKKALDKAKQEALDKEKKAKEAEAKEKEAKEKEKPKEVKPAPKPGEKVKEKDPGKVVSDKPIKFDHSAELAKKVDETKKVQPLVKKA
jgi:hypothetical protein